MHIKSTKSPAYLSFWTKSVAKHKTDQSPFGLSPQQKIHLHSEIKMDAYGVHRSIEAGSRV